jgi:hypothetical protein
MKGIVAMQKAGQQAAQPKPEEKEKPKAPTGPSLLDKVSDDAAKQEPGAAAPDQAAPAPAADGTTPAPAPAPAPKP